MKNGLAAHFGLRHGKREGSFGIGLVQLKHHKRMIVSCVGFPVTTVRPVWAGVLGEVALGRLLQAITIFPKNV